MCEPLASSKTTDEPLARRCGFWVETLSSDTFAIPPRKPAWRILQSIWGGSDSWDGPNPFSGKVNCTLSFTYTDGHSYLAVGCDEGVWIGYHHDSQFGVSVTDLRRVLHLKMVTQCAVLEELGIFLVLASKTLLAYDIEFLLPSSRKEEPSRLISRLGGSDTVQFFSVGSLAGRTLVICMSKEESKSFFCIFEPVDMDNEGQLRFTRLRWFRKYRNFALSSEAYNLVFLQERIVIICKKGIEIMDLSESQHSPSRSMTMPQFNDTHPDLKELAKRCGLCRPMGLFRSNKEEYLLCYDKFGFYVNNIGEPDLTKGTIEWEGSAEHVAWHPPYVLIFNSRFIEVRHISAGRLCQTIRGNDIRCTSKWDGCTGSPLPSPLPRPDPDGPWGEATVRRTPVCGVMRTDDGSQEPAGPSINVMQRVFRLAPTLPHEEISVPALADPLCVRFGRTTLNPKYDLPPKPPRPPPPLATTPACVIM